MYVDDFVGTGNLPIQTMSDKRSTQCMGKQWSQGCV